MMFFSPHQWRFIVSFAWALSSCTALSSVAQAASPALPDVEIHLEALSSLKRDAFVSEPSPFQEQLQKHYGRLSSPEVETAAPSNTPASLEKTDRASSKTSSRSAAPTPSSSLSTIERDPSMQPGNVVVAAPESDRLPIVVTKPASPAPSLPPLQRETVIAAPEVRPIPRRDAEEESDPNSAGDTLSEDSEEPKKRNTFVRILTDLVHGKLPSFGPVRSKEMAENEDDTSAMETASSSAVETNTKRSDSVDSASIPVTPPTSLSSSVAPAPVENATAAPLSTANAAQKPIAERLKALIGIDESAEKDRHKQLAREAAERAKNEKKPDVASVVEPLVPAPSVPLASASTSAVADTPRVAKLPSAPKPQAPERKERPSAMEKSPLASKDARDIRSPEFTDHASTTSAPPSIFKTPSSRNERFAVVTPSDSVRVIASEERDTPAHSPSSRTTPSTAPQKKNTAKSDIDSPALVTKTPRSDVTVSTATPPSARSTTPPTIVTPSSDKTAVSSASTNIPAALPRVSAADLAAAKALAEAKASGASKSHVLPSAVDKTESLANESRLKSSASSDSLPALTPAKGSVVAKKEETVTTPIAVANLPTQPSSSFSELPRTPLPQTPIPSSPRVAPTYPAFERNKSVAPASQPSPAATRPEVSVAQKPLVPSSPASPSVETVAAPALSARAPSVEETAPSIESSSVATSAPARSDVTQMASLPPSAPKDATSRTPIHQGSSTVQLLFSNTESKLSDADKSLLTNGLSSAVLQKNKRIRIVSYAAPDDAQGNKSRRVSLQRAISVRAHLLSLGIESTRINVQAMGDKFTSPPADRVDVFVVDK